MNYLGQDKKIIKSITKNGRETMMHPSAKNLNFYLYVTRKVTKVALNKNVSSEQVEQILRLSYLSPGSDLNDKHAPQF